MDDRELSKAESDNDLPWVMAEPKEVAPGEEQSNPTGLIVLAGLFALLWFGAGPRYFLVVLGLLVMIFLHELGHFMTARWTGMKATSSSCSWGHASGRSEEARPSTGSGSSRSVPSCASSA